MYLDTYRHEWVSEVLYMRISTQNTACSQRQMNTCVEKNPSIKVHRVADPPFFLQI